MWLFLCVAQNGRCVARTGSFVARSSFLIFIGSLKKLIFSFLRSKFGLYQGNSALSARFFCGTLPKIVCNFLIIRGTIRKKTPLSHARPAATVVAPPLPRPPGSGANMPPVVCGCRSGADVVKMWPVWCKGGADLVQHTRCADVVKMWPVWCSPIYYIIGIIAGKT